MPPMNAPLDPTDPLPQILKEEAADLPLKAAVEAGKTRAQLVKRRRRVAFVVMAMLCGMCAWPFVPQGPMRQETAAIPGPSAAPEPSVQPLPHVAGPSTPPSPLRQEAAIVRTEEQARIEPLPLPDGLTGEQESVVKAARGLPLLLVRDTTGRVVRIHAIER